MATSPSKTNAEELKDDRPKKFMIYVGLGRLLKKPTVKSSSKWRISSKRPVKDDR